MTPQERQKAREMLDIFYGRGSGGKLNFAYGDSYYIDSIERCFGMSLEEIKKEVGYAVPRVVVLRDY